MLITDIMLLTVLRERLLQCLNRAAATTGHDTNHAMTVMVKIDVTQDRLTLSSTNLIASTVASCPCITKTIGSTVANAARLIAIVSGFDEGVEIKFQLVKDQLAVSSGNRRYVLRTHDVSTFPPIAIIADSETPIELPPMALRTVFERVQRFNTSDKLIMDGVYMRTSGTTLEAMAVSSQRWARATIPIQATIDKAWFIPRSFYKSAEKIFTESERVTVNCGARYMSLESEGYLTGTLIPQNTQPMPESLEFSRAHLMKLESHEDVVKAGINMDCHPLNKALTAVGIGFNKVGFAAVTLDAKVTEFGNSLCINGGDNEGDCGDVVDIAPLLVRNSELYVKINLTFLSDVIKSLGGILDKQVGMQEFAKEEFGSPLLGISVVNFPDTIGTSCYIISPLV